MSLVQPKYTDKGWIPRIALSFYFHTLERYMRGFDYSKILEVGCGEGFILEKVLDFGSHSLVGIDLDIQRLKLARKFAPHAMLIQADAHFLPFPPSSFDVVLLLEVLEHVGEPERVLKEVNRITKKFVLISVPHEPWWRIGNILRGKYVRNFGNTPEHIHHWGWRGIRKLVLPYFEIEKMSLSFLWIFILGRKRE